MKVENFVCACRYFLVMHQNGRIIQYVHVSANRPIRSFPWIKLTFCIPVWIYAAQPDCSEFSERSPVTSYNFIIYKIIMTLFSVTFLTGCAEQSRVLMP